MIERIPSLRHFSQKETGKENVSDLPEAEARRRQLYIREFQLPHQVEIDLSHTEFEMLNLLVKATRSTANLYAYQEGEDPIVNFYPHGITKAEIEKAAEINPEILFPYTVVKENQAGELETMPVHQVFEKKIKDLGITKLLKGAANLAGKGKNRDNNLQAYLRAKARSLETGDFEASERIWLERDDEPKIDIVIGPYDTYIDQFFGRKFAWQSWVGVLDEQVTHDSQWFLDSILGWWQKETGATPPRVKMRIDNTRIQAGQAAKYNWTGNSLPCQNDWRKKYGSKFTIFKPVFEDKSGPSVEAYRLLIDGNKRAGVTDSLVKTAILRRYIAHEASHALGIADDIEERLQKFAAPIKELYCDLLAIKGYFAIPNISMRERDLAFATAFTEGSIDYTTFREHKKRGEYYVASSVILKHCLKEECIKIEDRKITWEDSRQVLANLSQLFDKVKRLQLEGKSKDAEDFYLEYFDPTVYSKLMQEEKLIPDFLLKTFRNKKANDELSAQGFARNAISAS